MARQHDDRIHTALDRIDGCLGSWVAQASGGEDVSGVESLTRLGDLTIARRLLDYAIEQAALACETWPGTTARDIGGPGSA